MKEPGERPSKRRCFWEYRRARETATKKKLGGDVHWSLSWSSSTLPSTLYRREGESAADPRSPCSLFVLWSARAVTTTSKHQSSEECLPSFLSCDAAGLLTFAPDTSWSSGLVRMYVGIFEHTPMLL